MLKYSERKGVHDAFSLLHTCAYSIIGLQEANLFTKYPSIYWYTSNLLLMSGSLEKEDIEGSDFKIKEQNTEYGKIAKAISKVQERGVTVELPNINNSAMGFDLNEDKNSIIFGLKGIAGINEDTAKIIINNRPYKSATDFVNRLVLKKIPITKEDGGTKMVSQINNGQMVKLIKSGCLDDLENKPRGEILENYLKTMNPSKATLTVSNIDNVAELGIIPEDYKLYLRIYNFKKFIWTLKKHKDEINPKQSWVIIKCSDEETTEYTNNFLNQYFLNDMSEDVGYRYNEQGIIEVLIGTKKNGSFEKLFNGYMDSFKEWLNSKECLDLYNKITFDNIKRSIMQGNISKWEMETVSFYNHEHELTKVNTEKYNITDFSTLTDKPVIIGYNNYKGIEYPKYELHKICGTVLDRDKNRHTITILTTNGIVNVKFYGGQFSFYDKNISILDEETNKKKVLENGWFKRGNLLLISGYRIDDNFFPKKYKNSVYRHTLQLIKGIDENGDLELQSERVQINNEED